jgi:hypothetical protein
MVNDVPTGEDLNYLAMKYNFSSISCKIVCYMDTRALSEESGSSVESTASDDANFPTARTTEYYLTLVTNLDSPANRRKIIYSLTPLGSKPFYLSIPLNSIYFIDLLHHSCKMKRRLAILGTPQ